MTKAVDSVKKLQKSDKNDELFIENDEFINEKAELLKIVSHPIRLKIISLLMEEAQDYSTIFSKVDTRKGALANHLNILIEQGLIHRLQRGRYQITTDGTTLYYTINNIFKKSKVRFRKNKENLKRAYAGFDDRNIKAKNIVPNEPFYQNSWNTFVASTTGVLKSLGKDCDIHDVSGYSGMAFIMNVAKGEICSSADRVYSDSARPVCLTRTDAKFGSEATCRL